MARKSRKNQPVLQPVIRQPEIPVPEKMPTALYARLSVEKETTESIQTQVVMISQYIKENPELELYDSYIDNGYSGTKFERPDFMRMMEDVRKGKICCIVVKDLSRFGRNFLETGYYLETILPRLNVRLISINDDFDSVREKDRENIAIPLKNIINEYYAKDISKKVSAYHELHRQRGDVKILRSIYGYRRDAEHNCLVVNPETAPIVQIIFRWYHMGIMPGRIAKRLNLMDVMPPIAYKEVKEKGGIWDPKERWNNARVRDILKNRTYTGALVWGRRRISFYNNIPEHKTKKEDWVICENMHQPLVPQELFDEVQEMIGKTADQIRRKPEIYETVRDCFSGKVFCGICGKRMLMEKNLYNRRKRGAQYFCDSGTGRGECNCSIQADYLKMVVADQMQVLIQAVVDRKKVLERKQKENNSKSISLKIESKIQSARMKLEEMDEKLTSLYENLSEGVIGLEDYYVIKEHYQQEKQKLQEELSHSIIEREEAEKKLQEFLRLSEHLEEYLGDKSFRQNLVDELIEKIIVGSDHSIEIIYSCEDVFQSAVSGDQDNS